MVRKVSTAFALCLLLITLCSAQASALEGVYLIDDDTMTFYQYIEPTAESGTYAVGDGSIYDGTISTTYLTIFRDVVSNLGIFDDYVFYRSGQYEYALIAGDLNYDGTRIRLSGSGTQYVLTYQSNYGSDNYYHWEVSDISSFSLTMGDYLVYSNLGNYPTLEGRETIYAFGTFFTLCVLGLCALLRSCFGYVLRSRG